ncbi:MULTISPECIES: aspartate carbamoyltransferase regulatory subunit [Salinivibrio]|jgi:aspartate carbamoyltransferase regulatory subunit|uniref:Aspartate carbamoyltransferase regulatory chain n=2 Tax=Salinivibrio TaxID=51366 RepID=A0ABY7LCY4_9GAMM|nr:MULTISPECIES: aspartate carbamoyltransferase regulatory subunit [Salinivibrio]ODP98205.1 aspartate carbamoyltransferase regulatory subunit [Salinivibrio sp. DV]OOF12502.1 aspartate carbamoyltransferase regulatory subunit [Salinivibrio sp. PR5]OOF15125.1 aspartate carbamoyltransferase regulatory subunit [Salinivibrio sp. PR919]OOF18496.1 aspartate carbamoyltransferase regulatory subunit [Salinivibrio sp. PR932]OOF20063.1 aspartate carbamoyltransferase regulatory subunit [Salinivibrio sp. IB5
MNTDSKLQVEAIRNGTVIDHIPAHIGFKILNLFQMHGSEERITIGLNLPSSALGSKDLIKIENVVISEDQASQLALYAPQATVNQIEEYQVVAKLPLTLPEVIQGVFRCPNSNCITHGEPAVVSSFRVLTEQQDVKLRCKYCEKVFSREIMTENH